MAVAKGRAIEPSGPVEQGPVAFRLAESAASGSGANGSVGTPEGMRKCGAGITGTGSAAITFGHEERGQAVVRPLRDRLEAGLGHEVAEAAAGGVVDVPFDGRDADVEDEPTPEASRDIR